MRCLQVEALARMLLLLLLCLLSMKDCLSLVNMIKTGVQHKNPPLQRLIWVSEVCDAAS
jgi:hypothetical protein